MLKIEKSIPIPAKTTSSLRKFPFKEMEIGDSFLVPIAKDKSPSAIYAAVSKARKDLGRQFITARVEGGVRVWRIEKEPARALSQSTAQEGGA